MRYLLLSLILFLGNTTRLMGQEALKYSKDSDTAFWYEVKSKYVKEYNLGFIENETWNTVFRFSSDGLAITLLKDSSNFSGSVVLYVDKYPFDSKRITYKKEFEIKPEQVARAFVLIDSLKIKEMLSYKSIHGWQQHLDGTFYFIEWKDERYYSFKVYDTPSSQGILPEAKKIIQFKSELERVIGFKSFLSQFQRGIPFQSWSYPGSTEVQSRVTHRPNIKKSRN